MGRGSRIGLAVLVGSVLVLSACGPVRTSSLPSPSTEATSSEAATPTSEATPATTSPAALKITSLPFHPGEVLLPYAAVALAAAGGLPPYAWSVSAGAYPPGLTLSSGGIASGTNSAAGKFSFTVKVADSGGATATAPAGITVYAAMAVTQPCASKCIIGTGCTRCGGFGTVKQGLGPYSYRIVGGAVPKGMTMSGLSLKGGFPAGAYSLSVVVTDQLNAQATVGANWSIYAPAVLRGGSGCTSSANPPACTTTGWSYSGGNPSVAPKLVIVSYSQYCDPFTGQCFLPSSPPPGWSATVRSGVITMSAGGITCSGARYAGYLTLALVDTTACATTLQSNKVALLVDISNNC